MGQRRSFLTFSPNRKYNIYVFGIDANGKRTTDVYYESSAPLSPPSRERHDSGNGSAGNHLSNKFTVTLQAFQGRRVLYPAARFQGGDAVRHQSRRYS